MPIEDIGKPVGDQGDGIARHHVGIAGRRIEQLGLDVVERGGPHIDTDVPAGEGSRAQARILQRLPGHVQHDALLRVHLNGLARRNAEHGRIEIPDAVDHAGGEAIGLARLAPAGVVVARRLPAVVTDAPDARPAGREIAPEGGGRLRARQAAGESDDIDGEGAVLPSTDLFAVANHMDEIIRMLGLRLHSQGEPKVRHGSGLPGHAWMADRLPWRK